MRRTQDVPGLTYSLRSDWVLGQGRPKIQAVRNGALVFLGEPALIPGTIYSWEQLKVEYLSVSDIGFLTPFSVVLEVSCLASLFHVTKPADKEHYVRVSLFIAEDFIEYLTYKYPVLEKL